MLVLPHFETALRNLQAAHEDEVEQLRSQIQALQEQLVNKTTSEDAFSMPRVPRLGPCTASTKVRPVSCAADSGIFGEDEVRQQSQRTVETPALSEPRFSVIARQSESSVVHVDSSQRTLVAIEQTVSSRRNVVRPSQNIEGIFPALFVEEARFARRLEDPRFEALSMLLIFLNTVAMLVQAQYEGYGVAHSLEVAGYNATQEEAWPKVGTVLDVAERAFIILFTIELALRLVAYRMNFFYQAYHWLDLIVVIAGLLDWIVGDTFDPTMLRMLRFVRLTRILRSFSNPLFADALYLLTASIRASLTTLVWSIVVLVIIQSIAALSITQLLSGWFEDAPRSTETRQVFYYYGTFTKAMLTMFEILTANWIVPCRVLSDNVGEIVGLVVLVYRCVCGFAVLNVISAVFINQTMKVMSQDTHVMLLERGRVETKYRNNLEKLFDLMDMSHDGFITRDEMNATLQQPDVHMACFNMGLSIHDLEDILGLCNLDDEGMPIHKFIKIAHDIRKQANTLDVARVLVHARNASVQIAKIQKRLDQMYKNIADINAACTDRTALSVSEKLGGMCGSACTDYGVSLI